MKPENQRNCWWGYD